MRGRLAEMVGLVVVLGAIGCGKGAQKNPDGGDGSLTIPDAPATGWLSFDVVAVLAADGSTEIPPTNRFTLVQDLTALRVIAGGAGHGAVVPVTGNIGTFRTANPFTVGGTTADACSGPQEVRYDSIQVASSGRALVGTAKGAVSISCGDCSFFVPVTASLTGTADTTVPTLRASGPLPATPFDPLWLAASEPLPVGVTAKLLADDGASIDLVPQIVDGDPPVVVGFYKPDVILRAGQGYVVTLDGLVDFAGLSSAGDVPLRVTSFPAAPTLAEDGFESATGASLGGATVVTAAQMQPIAGDTSLYVGPPGAPGITSTNSASLMVRLARQPGDTKLRFSYRTIAGLSQATFVGTLRVGSEGASTGDIGFAFGAAAPAQEIVTVAGQMAYRSAVTSMEQPLPADATDSVLVLITSASNFCGPGPLLNAGLLIDDLRLE